MEAWADVVRAGKALYIGVSEWTADQIRDAHGLARELKIPFVSNQPQYNMLWRVIEAEVIPTSQELGIGQVVWSPIGQGVLTGKYLPGQQPPSDSRAAHEDAGASMRDRLKDGPDGKPLRFKETTVSNLVDFLARSISETSPMMQS